MPGCAEGWNRLTTRYFGRSSCRLAPNATGAAAAACKNVRRIILSMICQFGPGDRHAEALVRGLHSSVLRNRSALLITDTELNVMAALAIIGLSNNPKNGKR